GVLGAAFIAYSIWLNPVPLAAIAIELPKEGEKVDYKTIVHGTFSGRLPAGLGYLWGAVTPVSGDFQTKNEWWPQNPITPVGEGWDIACEIGDESRDIGKDKEYLLGVFLMDSEADNSFWNYKKTWESNNHAPYDLNKFLQTGHVKTCRIIKVIRK